MSLPVKPLRTHPLFSILLLCLMIVGPIGLWAQERKFEFHPDYQYNIYHLGRDQGLRGNLIHGLIQDSKGYIWLVTNGWVQRYNGRIFETFWKIPETANYHIQLEADQQDRIWVIKSGQRPDNPYRRRLIDLAVIFPEKGEVLTQEEVWNWQGYDFERADITAAGNNRKDHSVLFGLADGRVVEAGGGGKLVARATYGAILKIASDRDGRIAVNSGDHLELLSGDNQPVSTYRLEQPLLYLSMDEAGGMIISHPPEYQVPPAYIPYGGVPQHTLPDFDLDFTKTPHLEWHVTDEVLLGSGMLIKKGESPPILRCLNCPKLYLDRQMNVWTSNFSGLTVVQPKQKLFKALLSRYNPETRGILPLDDSLLMVHSYLGTFVVDTQDSVHRYNRHLAANIGIARDAAGRIWKGVHGSEIQYTSDYRKESTNGSLTGEALIEFGHQTLFPLITKKDQLWMGTNLGLYYYPREKGALPERYVAIKDTALQQATVHYLQEADSLIWAATSAGLFEIDPVSRTVVRHHEALKGLNINHFARDGQTVWFSTYYNGLVKWEYGSDRFRAFHLAEEGPFQEIPSLCAVYDDGLGYLWLPSNIGLYRFKKSDETYRRYDVNQGIAHNEFNYYSHSRLPDGRLAFGGLNGITLIDPAIVQLLDSQEPPFQLQLTNGAIIDGSTQKKVILQNNMPLTLFGQRENLEIECHLLDFRSAEKGHIAYLLEGLDEEWTVLDGNKLRLDRLPYGSYSLRVKGLTFDNLSEGNEWQIPIHAVRPWYRQTWFKILLFAILGSLIALRFHAIKRAKIRLEELVAKRTAEINGHRNQILSQNEELKLFNDYRNKIMAIMGHDLRGPIIGLSNMNRKLHYLLSKGDMERFLLLHSDGEKQVEHLRTLIDNILAWSLIQNKQTAKFDTSPLLLARVVEGQLEIVQAAAEIKNQTLKLDIEEDSYFISNIFVLGVLVRNILSNSIRYSEKGSTITIQVTTFGLSPCVNITDDGPGMPAELMDALNRFADLHMPFQSLSPEGLGLGLWICSSLLQSLGGKWRFNPGPSGAGLSVSIWFPEVPHPDEALVQSVVNSK